MNDPKPKVHRRKPEHVTLILALMEQYPRAFQTGKDEFDARHKRVRVGGKLIRTPEAYWEREMVCRRLWEAKLGPGEVESMTGFPQSTIYPLFQKFSKKAQCKTTT